MAGLHATVQVTNGAVTTSAKSMLGVKAASNHPILVHEVFGAFDGTDIADTVSLVEICNCDGSTNWTPGANNTEVTPVQWGSRFTETIQTKGLSLWSSEPTVLTVIAPMWIPTLMGSDRIVFDPPIQVAAGKGLVLRVDGADSVNFTGWIHFEE